MQDESRKYEWIERVVKVAAVFGANPVALRWRLMRWQDRREAEREAAAVTAAHVRYAHAVCHECGRVQPRGTKECLGCGAVLGTRAEQVVRRVGLVSPVAVSAVTLLVGLIALAYVKQVVAARSLSSFDVRTLIELGAHWAPLERRGEWWRLGTAMFLHGNLMHVAFNAIALTQIGPLVEDAFGRGRTAFLFVATGALAFLPGMLLGSPVPSVGASGGVMGMLGAAAGWGQRDGTTIGRTVRNHMLKWLLYTTIFGLLLRADHLAHFTGFGLGAILGYASPPRRRGAATTRLDFVLGAVAAVVALGLVAIIWTRKVTPTFD